MPKLTFILGGAASGKSNYAETLVKRCDIPRIYVATAQAFDAEMETKIAAHRAARAADHWTTIESPLDLPKTLSAAPPGHAILVDCLTLWLSNVLLERGDTETACADLLAALDAHPGPLVMVSNEVGQGIVPDTSLGRRFRAAQGALNQSVAARANSAVAVMAGLPLALKGPLP